MRPVRVVITVAAVVCVALYAGSTLARVQGTPAPVAQPQPVLPVADVVATPDAAPTPSPTAPIARRAPVFGGDVSWPNCPLGTPGHLPKRPAKGLPMPGPEAEFVIIGLTNGPGFYPNPCLPAQVAHAKKRHLLTAAYAFTTLPNAAQVATYGGTGPWPATSRLNRVRNASYAEAQININSIRDSGLRTPMVWLDIEPQNYLGPWGTDVTTNRAVIRAVQKAYHQAGFRTGFYSGTHAWKDITGGLRDSSPTWVTSGPRSRAVAAAKCTAPSFSGGPVALSQYWVEEVADYDLTCGLARRYVDHFFAAN